MQKMTVAGRLGRDAEIKTTQGGTSVCRFSVAADKKRGGEKVTTWYDVSLFGKRGEVLCAYLRKGTTICVVGDLEARTYEAKDGSTRLALGIVADDVSLLGGGQRDEQRDAEGKSGGSYDRPAPRGGDAFDGPPDDLGDGDIPF